MLRFVRAMLWVRWRVLANSLRSAWRRDVGERISRLLAAGAPLLFLLFVLPVVLGLTVAGGLAGFAIGGGNRPDLWLVITRLLLFIVTLAVPLGPLVRSTQGADLDPVRLSLLPISTRWLHVTHIIGAAGEPWLFAVIPGLLLLPAGLLLAGAGTAALFALAGGALLLVALACLGSLSTFVTTLVLRDRRRAEWLTVTAMIVFVSLAVAPSLVDGWADPEMEEQLKRQFGEGLAHRLAWARFLPSEAYGLGLDDATSARYGAASGRLAWLALAAGLLYAASAVAHRRVLGGSRSGRRRVVAEKAGRRWRRLPGLSREASAVAWTHARATLRTVRGKLAVYPNLIMPVLLNFGVLRALSETEEGAWLTQDYHGPLLYLVGFLFSLLSLQPIVLNMFAIDRSGLTLQLITPIGDRDLVLGKIVGSGLLTFLSSGLCLVVALVLSPRGSPLLWIATVIATLSTYAVYGPAALMLSALLPKSADLSRLGRAGNPHAAAALLGFFLASLAFSPSLALLLAPVLLSGNVAAAAGLGLVWLAVAGAIAFGLGALGVTVLRSRRENLLLVAGSR